MVDGVAWREDDAVENEREAALKGAKVTRFDDSDGGRE